MRNDQGLVAALRRHLFGSRFSSITTLILVLIFFQTIPDFIAWALIHPVWTADAALCKQSMGEGACWGVITEKYRVIIFGYYPHAEHWRPLLATSLLLALLVASCTRALWSRWLLLLWLVVVAAVFVILHGGYWGLSGRRDRSLGWAAFNGLAGKPFNRGCLSVERSYGTGQTLRDACGERTVYGLYRIDSGCTPEGLQAIPKGQIEAAQSLGMTYWQTQRKIVLPQALAMVVPGVMNNFIGIFKDTSLVTIVSLYELTGALGLALNSDADWRPFKLEAYLFIYLDLLCGLLRDVTL